MGRSLCGAHVTQNTRALVEITGHICPPPRWALPVERKAEAGDARTYAQFCCRLFRRRQSQLQRLQPHPVRPGRRAAGTSTQPLPAKRPAPGWATVWAKSYRQGRPSCRHHNRPGRARQWPTHHRLTHRSPVTPWPLSLSDMPVGWAVAPPSSGSARSQDVPTSMTARRSATLTTTARWGSGLATGYPKWWSCSVPGRRPRWPQRPGGRSTPCSLTATG